MSGLCVDPKMMDDCFMGPACLFEQIIIIPGQNVHTCPSFFSFLFFPDFFIPLLFSIIAWETAVSPHPLVTSTSPFFLTLY
ncbi:hypothetical protein BDV25DRAFT_167136 [Aspergillus avenaceus]|uniref:Uncharacterized protein n=1 Tax=Aspergillus avenaceus TaxID=36643 RepID=A0A5N6TDE4_ASPAV|nr:hypothetical protein BDV25DRAFT_167136 [Aspergillus avenaceus]